MEKTYQENLERVRNCLNLLVTSLEKYEEKPQRYDMMYHFAYSTLIDVIPDLLHDLDEVYKEIRKLPF